MQTKYAGMMLFSAVVGVVTGCQSNAKSTESGVSPDAPSVVFYAATGESCCGEDPHPVHGVEAPDGSFILGGKSIDAQGENDGFLLKIGPALPDGTVFLEDGESNEYTWSQTFGSAGKKDAANSLAATENGVFVAGIEGTASGVAASLRKYDLTTGEMRWSALFPASNTSADSAFESIFITPQGGAILGGLTNGDSGGLEGFKSYGNPISGDGYVAYFSAAQLSSGSAPEAAVWTTSFADIISIRNIRPVADDGYVLVAAQTEDLYVVVRIDNAGDERWRTELPDHGEATDIAVLSVEGQPAGFAVTGHTFQNGGIDGSVTKLDLNGSILWRETYGNPVGGIQEFAGLDAGNPKLIYDECWGIQPTSDGGAVLACGTGIEGCDEYTIGSAIRRECRADPRTKWRALTIEIDSDGTELWSRADSYYFPEEEEAAASASEYVIRTATGQTGAVIDQDFGIGLILFEATE